MVPSALIIADERYKVENVSVERVKPDRKEIGLLLFVGLTRRPKSKKKWRSGFVVKHCVFILHSGINEVVLSNAIQWPGSETTTYRTRITKNRQCILSSRTDG